MSYRQLYSSMQPRWHVALLVCALVVVLAGCGRSDVPANRPAAPAANNRPNVAQVPSATATGPELDATKQAMDDNIQHEIATARALPSPTAGVVPIPTMPPNTLPTETGLSFECLGVLPRLFTHTNCWRDTINGNYVAAFAGAATSDATEGWVIVITGTVDGALGSDPTIYKTPTKVGRVEITQASYPYLTLTTDNGIVFVFNLVTLTWENPASTPTPSPTGSPVPTATPGGALTFTPAADARVEEEFPTNNYATSSQLEVDGGSDLDSESYLRFTVTGVSGTVQHALLRVYSTTNDSDNGPAVYTADNTWTETGITWNNRPARTSGPLEDKSAIGTNTWVEYDVTIAVTGNGTYTFVLATDDDDGVIFSAREGSNPAQLVVTPGTPPSSYTLPAVADTRVKQANPTTNYGTSSSLDTDGSSGELVESYLRFTIGSLPGTIQQVKLRLYTTGSTVNGPALYATSGSWTETGVTWNTRPTTSGGALDNKGAISTGVWVEYNVTALVTGSGTYNVALVADDGDGITFSSREGSNPPQLVVTLVP
jgi:hypothetical protein